MKRLELLIEVMEAFEKVNEARNIVDTTNTALLYSLLDLSGRSISLLEEHGIKDAELDELLNRVSVLMKELSDNRKTHLKLLESAVEKQEKIVYNLN